MVAQFADHGERAHAERAHVAQRHRRAGQGGHDGGLWSVRDYSNACTGGRSDAPLFGGVAGLVIEPLCG